MNAVTELAFLWRARGQSGFTEGIRRMHCDQKPGIRAYGVDFCQHLRNRFRYFPETRFWIASGLPNIQKLSSATRIAKLVSLPSR